MQKIRKRLFNSLLAVVLLLFPIFSHVSPVLALTDKSASQTVNETTANVEQNLKEFATNDESSPSEDGATATLRIMETTDLHSNIVPYDYYKDTDEDVAYGLAKTATLIQQARSEVKNSMLFDAGDMIQGNPLASYVKNHLKDDETHPLFAAMNALEYDAAIIGNHEFNYGLDYLDKVLEGANFPILNANVYKLDEEGNIVGNYFTPYEILDKKIIDDNGNESIIKVGVIGFTPPQVMVWDKSNLTGKVDVEDIVKTAEKFIPKMREEGADIIIAIAHSGCDIYSEGKEYAENAVYDLTKVPGIDVMLFGHAHLVFPGGSEFNGLQDKGIDNEKGTINGIPATEAGYWGSHLGVIDLNLKKVGGKWTIVESKTDKPHAVSADTKAASEIINLPEVRKYHEATIEYVRSVIGKTIYPLNTYFTRVMDDAAVQLVNKAQIDYAQKWIAENAPELSNIPVISAAAPYKGGRGGANDYTNIPAGELSIKSASDLYVFDNTIKAVEMTGAQVKEWLEFVASSYNQIDPDKKEPQDLLDSNFRPYNFDVIDGIKYEIDVTKPRRYNWASGEIENEDAHRIIKFTYMDGTPIGDDDPFIVVTNNYRQSGGGGFPYINSAKVVIDSTDENREVIVNYVLEHGTINEVADNNWKIAPINGDVTLIFESASNAQQYLNMLPNITKYGNGSTDGYTTYQYDQRVYAQILGINDFHGQLDYSTKINNKPVGGIEYLSGYLKARKAENPANTLMVSVGDLVGASRPVSALLQDEPTIRFMNEIGFDLATIGNHEFDEGVPEMLRLIYGGYHEATGDFEGAAFPYVAANVYYNEEQILPPYLIKEINGVPVGFIGVVTQETMNIVTKSALEGVEITDEVEAINQYAQELKEQGVKAIIVLAHNSGSSELDGSNAVGDVVEFAKQVDSEIDIIFGGHDHKYLNTTVNGILLVQSYSYGTAFSDVDIVIDPITKDIVSKSAEIVTTFHEPEYFDEEIKAKLDELKSLVADKLQQVVGEAATEITRAQNEAGESALGNLIADGMRDYTGTDFAFMNPGGIRADLDAGPITYEELFAIQPFGNTLVTMKMTGSQIQTVLEQQFQENITRIMQISGLKYTWDPNQPIGSKIIDIYLPSGEKIDPNAYYSVTVNNFMADGGDNYLEFTKGTDRQDTGTIDLDVFVDYVKKLSAQGPINPKIEGRITLAKESIDVPGKQPGDSNGETPGNTDHSGNQPGQGKGDSKLPSTATNNFNILFAGIIVVGAGGTIYFIYRRKQEKVH